MAFTKTEAKALSTVGSRSKFDEATKEKALRWLLSNADKGATMASAAEQFGMSTQTLAAYRKSVLVEHGLAEAAVEE